MGKLIVRFIPRYECEIDGSQHWLEFRRVDRAPGFTHRVILDGKPVDWLSNDYQPSIKTARFYFDKHLVRRHHADCND